MFTYQRPQHYAQVYALRQALAEAYANSDWETAESLSRKLDSLQLDYWLEACRLRAS